MEAEQRPRGLQWPGGAENYTSFVSAGMQASERGVREPEEIEEATLYRALWAC